jgi:hypothetical protein
MGWRLTLYPQAGEASATYWGSGADLNNGRPNGGVERADTGTECVEGIVGVADAEDDRSVVEAARRARGKVRRYCAANGTNRLGTLTYRGGGNHDPAQVRSDLGAFFRTLRRDLGGDPFPYVWVPEWHKTDHGLHAHFAVGRYIRRSLIEHAWPHGFVHIKLVGDLPVGSGVRAEARKAGRYLSKYAGKAFDAQRLAGFHRYDVAQGFQPRVEYLSGLRLSDVIGRASGRMGSAPDYSSVSSEWVDYGGPPAAWFSWDH